MKCLLVAARDAKIELLRSVLAQMDVSSETSTAFRAGVGLRTVPLDDFDFAVVVLPMRAGAKGAAAVLVETGILVGRGMPVFVVDPGADDWAALSDLPSVRTDLANPEALRLHLQLFVGSLGDLEPELEDWTAPPVALTAESAAQYLARASALLDDGLPEQFEQLVIELLSESGALIEPRMSERMDGPDAAFVLPGAEIDIGAVVVEVKTSLRDRAARVRAQNQLLNFVLDGGAGLGLLVYGRDKGPGGKPSSQAPVTPRVVGMSFDQLVAELRFNALTDVLIAARNAAIHGI